jgi:hypothetical protein
MTPKEKASELKEKFDGYICYAEAAVTEIINSNPTSTLSDPFLGNRTYENVNYWKDVKKELEKL